MRRAGDPTPTLPLLLTLFLLPDIHAYTYTSLNSVAEGETRVGLLFGSVEERTPKVDKSNKPVRGRSISYSSSEERDGEDGKAKVVVKVAAVMELDAGFQQHG